MTIKVGDRLPAGTLQEFYEVEKDGCAIGPNPFKVEDLTQGKKVVLFGLPGAFTPTCSAKHVPSYLADYDKLKAKGVDDDRLHVGQRRVRDGRVGPRPARRRQGAHDGRRQRRRTRRRSASSSISPRAAWACAASASRCWSTTASSRRSTSRRRASSRCPAATRC